MALPKITSVTGRGVPFPGDDVDTDRIIPARFMKCVTFDGLGEHLFRDVRFDPKSGAATGHVFNDPRFAGASILFVGANFGCGSSREHAPQAIYRHGIRALVGVGFAEIFFGNSTTLGIPCLGVKREDLDAMVAAITANPAAEVVVDVEKLEVRVAGVAHPATLRDSARKGLLEGRWDAIGDLLDGLPAAKDLAGRLGYAVAA
jgi:3-isopropylmalate/(R)-2-methylmalate dehydratase small subunit